MRVVLFVAQGFGVGRIPVTPGTFGSVVGVLWFLLLLLPRSFPIFILGIVLSIPLSIWLCDKAEKILKQQDPGSVVMDEIVAIPLCFTGWLSIMVFQRGFWPEPAFFFNAKNWPMTLTVFVLFRIFDIAKPWPVRQSQKLPGGYGVVGKWSERQDSNLRRLAPKASALARLSYAPIEGRKR
jgi:phosphatidylglycerophosphatase A